MCMLINKTQYAYLILQFYPFFSLETSEDVVFNESRKNSLSEPINSCPHVTVSVTNETNEDLVSKEHPKLDPDDLDVTNTLDIDPAAYQGKSNLFFDEHLTRPRYVHT